jgi:hypothetical protein
MSSKHLLILFLFLSFLCIAGCSSRLRLMEKDWKRTTSADTTSAYSTFLSTYPDSPHRAEAQKRIDALDFAAAEAKGTEEAYAYFIGNHPESSLNPVAAQRLQEIRKAKARDDAFAKACNINTVAAYQKFIEAYSGSLESSEAKKFIDPAAARECVSKNFTIRIAVWTEEEQEAVAGFSLGGSDFGLQSERLAPVKGAVFVVLASHVERCNMAKDALRIEAAEEIKLVEPDGSEHPGMHSTFRFKNDELQFLWIPLRPASEPSAFDPQKASSVLLFPAKKSSLASLKVRFLGQLYDVGPVQHAEQGEIFNLNLAYWGIKTKPPQHNDKGAAAEHR